MILPRKQSEVKTGSTDEAFCEESNGHVPLSDKAVCSLVVIRNLYRWMIMISSCARNKGHNERAYLAHHTIIRLYELLAIGQWKKINPSSRSSACRDFRVQPFR